MCTNKSLRDVCFSCVYVCICLYFCVLYVSQPLVVFVLADAQTAGLGAETHIQQLNMLLLSALVSMHDQVKTSEDPLLCLWGVRFHRGSGTFMLNIHGRCKKLIGQTSHTISYETTPPPKTMENK